MILFLVNTQVISQKYKNICDFIGNQAIDFAYSQHIPKNGVPDETNHYINIEDNYWFLEVEGLRLYLNNAEGRKREFLTGDRYDFGVSFITSDNSHEICFYSVSIESFIS